MSSKSARREYLQAVAEFERACADFSRSMGRILQPPSDEADEADDASMRFIVSELGAAKPAKRAPPQEAAVPRRIAR